MYYCLFICVIPIVEEVFPALSFAKIVLPTDNENNSSENNILIQFNYGSDKLVVCLCTIKCNIHEVSIDRHINITSMNLNYFCLYCTIEIDWVNDNFKLFQNGQEYFLPKYVYVPFYLKYKVIRMENHDCFVRLLIGDKIYEQICIKEQALNYIKFY